MESDDEGAYSEDEGVYFDDEESYESDSDDSDYDTLDFAESNNLQKPYRVLQETEVRDVQNEQIEHLSSALSLSKGEATKLLYHYRWNESLLLEEWLEDEEKVRTKVGLLSSPANSCYQDQLTTCGICFESFPFDHDHFYPTVCGHSYCVTCWTDYLNISINDGPGCLSLRCPEPKCNAAVVDWDMIDKLASDGDRKKYARYFFRSYVEEKKTLKWCPGPGCENAVEFEIGNEVYDVTCLCSHSFCWNCVEEAHRPLNCDMVAKWALKNKSEAKNTVWIMQNSKRCPMCKRSIQKNQGCMHMTCNKPCGYQFCWLCLGPWTIHNKETGGPYKCNIYNPGKSKVEDDVEEQKRDMAKNDIQKYTFYYERWDGNHKSRQKAIADLHNIKTIVDSDKLIDRLRVIGAELGFVVNAWEQIIECRRVLKWTYAYGYYFPEHRAIKKDFFEYLQGQAEDGLEKLHQCVEQELSDFLEDDTEAEDQKEAEYRALAGKADHKKLTTDQEKLKAEQKLEADFNAFRLKLTELTIATRTYFENLVRALENDLSEVKPVPKRKKYKFRSSHS